MVQTSHVDFEWPQSENAETNGRHYQCRFMARHIDDVLPIVMYCLTRFVGFQRVRDNQSSKINASRIFLCESVCSTHTHIERRMHLVEHYIPRTSTLGITFHVEHYISRRAFTYHVHPCRQCGPYQTFGKFFFQVNSQVISMNNNSDPSLTNVKKK